MQGCRRLAGCEQRHRHRPSLTGGRPGQAQQPQLQRSAVRQQIQAAVERAGCSPCGTPQRPSSSASSSGRITPSGDSCCTLLLAASVLVPPLALAPRAPPAVALPPRPPVLAVWQREARGREQARLARGSSSRSASPSSAATARWAGRQASRQVWRAKCVCVYQALCWLGVGQLLPIDGAAAGTCGCGCCCRGCCVGGCCCKSQARRLLLLQASQARRSPAALN